MITRKKYLPGYYINIINGNCNEDKGDDNPNPHNYAKKKEIHIKNLIKLINYNILKKLKSTRKAAPTCQIKFSIETKIFHFLKKEFAFNSKFKESE